MKTKDIEVNEPEVITMEKYVQPYIESMDFTQKENSTEYLNGSIYRNGTIGIYISGMNVRITRYYHPHTRSMDFKIESLEELKQLFKFTKIEK